MEGAKEGLRAALSAFRTEEGLFETSKIDLARQRAIPSVTLRKGATPKQIGGVDVPFTGEIELGGKQVRLPGRALTAADAFFKSIAYRQEVNALATRQALDENLAGSALAQRIAELRANPTAEMTEAARAAAMKRTFTEPLGKGGKYYQGLVKEWPILRVLTPFVRTPTNIVKFAAERSPFAPLFKEVRETLAGKNGAAARDEQMAKMALGSSIGATAGYLASEGLVTGGGPVDPRKRALLYQSGWQPYSVRIGDTYYSFGRLEPLGMLFGIAADFVELAHTMTDEEAKGVAALITGSVARNLTSKTWLKGLSDAIEAFNDPDRYGQRWIMNLVGTVVPTGAAQWARTQDPYLRDARSLLDKMRERLPGYRETLPFRRDFFGEPIKLEGGIGPDIISPAYISTAQDDPARLGIAPSKPTRMIRSVELDAEQYDALQVATGQSARKLLNILVGTPNWKQIPDELKKDAIMDAMRQARDVGRAATVARFPDLANAIAQQQETAQ